MTLLSADPGGPLSHASEALEGPQVSAAAAPVAAAAPAPAPAAAAAAVPAAAQHRHKIRPADTLLSIAAEYGVSVQQLMRCNKLSSTDIWFRNHLLIPCTAPEAARRAAAAAEGSPPAEHGGASGAPPGAAAPAAAAAAAAAAGPLDNSGVSAAGEVEKNSKGKGGPQGPPKAYQDELQNNANIAMLVEGLLRETDIHPRLARQRIMARGVCLCIKP